MIIVTPLFSKNSVLTVAQQSLPPDGVRSVFENLKLCFRDGLEWTEGLTIEIKLRFQISPV